MNNIEVPRWIDTCVLSYNDLNYASPQQKEFYYKFKEEFINGSYIDIGNNYKYVFVLMYDIANQFKQTKDYNVFSYFLFNLYSHYPVVKDRINNILISSLLEVSWSYDISNIPVIETFTHFLYSQLQCSPFIIISVEKLMTFFNCVPTDKKNIHNLNCAYHKLFLNLGFIMIPGEIEQKDFSCDDICVIYKIEDSKEIIHHNKNQKTIILSYNHFKDFFIELYHAIHIISMKNEYKYIVLFLKIASIIILEDEIMSADESFLDLFIMDNSEIFIVDKYLNRLTRLLLKSYKIPQKKGTPIVKEILKLHIIRHLEAYSRWLLKSKKYNFNNYMKKYVSECLTSKQRLTVVNTLIRLVCHNGDVRTKRIKSLGRILPVFGYNIENIHSDIHHILTESDEFVTIEKTIDAVEYSINNKNINENNTIISRTFIDTNKLHILEQQSQAAQEMLSNIFIENEENDNNKSLPDHVNSSWKYVLNILSSKQIWTKDEVKKICNERGVIFGAMMEYINDIAYEKFEDVVVEDEGENIYINLDYTQDLL